MRIRESVPAKLGIAVVLAFAIAWVAAECSSPEAKADPAVGCQTQSGFWLFHGTQRDLCDGPRRGDGSWVRAREFYTPAHQVPLSTYCSGGSYYSSCSTTGGYWQPRTSNGVEVYPVTDGTVLGDEPGWIPPFGVSA